MNRIRQFLQHQPLFLLLLPVFFVLHGFNENFHYALANASLLLAVKYIAIAIALTAIAWLLFRNIFKAALFSFFALCIYFFFGSAHDFLKTHVPNSFLVKYSFILPAIIIFLGLLAFYLKRAQKSPFRFGLFLNVLFLLLIAMEVFGFFSRLGEGKPVYTANLDNVLHVDTASRPDIFLIIADEYAGNKTLRDIFSYDNSGFEQQLRDRGFHVVNNTRSNYNGTVYSMASMFSMDYIYNLRDTIVNHKDMFSCRSLIKNNNLLRFLKQRGYHTYNYSPFDFDDKSNFVVTPFFASKREFFTSQTLLNRLQRDLGYHLAKKDEIIRSKKIHLFNNIKIDSMTRVTAATAPSPKIVYTHLAMPHHPYYYTSDGQEAKIDPVSYEFPRDNKSYTEYLGYTNTRLLDLVDHIRRSSKQPPIIILMSDHGFRQFPNTSFNNYHFYNINAVLLPSRNYTGFYDGMTNVNQFRIILNTHFHQNLPMLKDSITVLWEPKQPIGQ